MCICHSHVTTYHFNVNTIPREKHKMEISTGYERRSLQLITPVLAAQSGEPCSNTRPYADHAH